MSNPKIVFASTLSALLLIASSFSCRTSPIGPHIAGNVQLSADYVACTEVWLKIAFRGQPSAISKFRITRDGDTVLTGSFSGTDTVVIDTTGQPERTYTYKGYRLTNGGISDTSLPLQVTTLDSTSHNFSWQVYQFGGAASSYLYDVSIVNDSDVWAVGAIYNYDSTGQVDPQPYGAVHWNGKSWGQFKVPYHDYGTTQKFPGLLRSVYAFAPSDVYVTSYANLLHWDGNSWSEKAFFMTSAPFTGQVNRMWGVDSSDLYCVGNGGAIFHYGFGNWQKLQSSTTLAIQDIWGRVDPKTGEEQVVAIASDREQNNGEEVLEIAPTSVTEVDNAGLPWSLNSIWSPDSRHYYTCGDGIYKNYSLKTSWEWNPYQAMFYTRHIRGNGVNDFVIAGDFGVLAHYNGATVREYNGHELPNIPGTYWSVDMKGNIIVAVGSFDSRQAIAVIGRR